MGAELLLFLGVFLVGLAVFLFVSTLIAGDESASPLMWASSEKPKERSGLIRIARPFVHKFTIPIVRRYGFKDYREKLKRRIVEAGMKEELNEEEYIGLQIFLGIFAPGLLFMANVLFTIGYPWWVIFFFALFGFFAPFLQTREAIEKRRAQVASDLPFVIDLLALSIAAGSDFMQALQKVVEKMDGGALADELQQVLRDLALGSSRSEALNGMAWRINMTEMTSLVATLVTADATGAPYATVLKQQSEQMRQNRFSRAEKLGAQASQKVFLPIVLFIIPAVFIVLFGPVLIQFVGFK